MEVRKQMFSHAACITNKMYDCEHFIELLQALCSLFVIYKIGQENKRSLSVQHFLTVTLGYLCQKDFQQYCGREEGKSDATFPGVLENKREILLEVFKGGIPKDLQGAYSIALPGNKRSCIVLDAQQKDRSLPIS